MKLIACYKQKNKRRTYKQILSLNKSKRAVDRAYRIFMMHMNYYGI